MIHALSTYHGAKNLMKTLLPAVAVSKFSGVNTVTSAAAYAIRVEKIESLIGCSEKERERERIRTSVCLLCHPLLCNVQLLRFSDFHPLYTKIVIGRPAPHISRDSEREKVHTLNIRNSYTLQHVQIIVSIYFTVIFFYESY